MTTLTADGQIEDFIARWAASQGAERANFHLFASKLCALLGVEQPKSAYGTTPEMNDYCFERGVKFKAHDGSTSDSRIDFYRKGAFVMEAKQSALDLDDEDDDEDAEAKPRFPTGKELEETAAVMSVLAATPTPIGITGIATRFAQGRQIEKRVGLTILALARLGHLSSTDNGQTFALRRVG